MIYENRVKCEYEKIIYMEDGKFLWTFPFTSQAKKEENSKR